MDDGSVRPYALPMQVVVADRADVAFNSLNPRDKSRVGKALAKVVAAQAEDGGFSPQALQLHLLREAHGSRLWVMRASQRLRLVVSVLDGVITIEDIVPHDRLDRIAGRTRG